MQSRCLIPCAVLGAAISSAALAQWDPANAQWLKSDATDLRVMTWNIEDGICTTAAKIDGSNAWCCLVRLVAAFQPDVLILQEMGDNSGNGTGSGVDTVGNLATTCELFIHGGADPFEGGSVTCYVQQHAPGYDLPFIFVSAANDSFNRNVVMSRFPFSDLNGDNRSTLNDIPLVLSHLYAPGGSGGIRGFSFVELDLPDETYAADLVVGNAHLKAGGATGDIDDRRIASQNVAYYIDHMLNGGGMGVPDPFGRIADSPMVQQVLPPMTPVIMGGDWNEDELTNGRKGPAEWLTQAENTGGTDGTDKDRSDMVYDDAREFFTNNRTTRGSSKLDYLAWQESVAGIRRSFIFNSSTTPVVSRPATITGLILQGSAASGTASDHRPVIVDFILPLATSEPCPWDLDGDGVVGAGDLAQMLGQWGAAGGNGPADFNMDGVVNAGDLAVMLGAWGACP